MGDLCGECERLWRENSAAAREHLGLNKNPRVAASVPSAEMWEPQTANSRSDRGLTVSLLKERIIQHETAAHRESADSATRRGEGDLLI